MNNNLKEGDIVKKDLRSRATWVIDMVDGKLMAIPITTKRFTDTDPIEITDDMIKLVDIGVNPTTFEQLFKGTDIAPKIDEEGNTTYDFKAIKKC